MLTIVTPASTTQLATVADACSELGVTVGGDVSARVSKLIDRASSEIASFCRRQFGSAVLSETLQMGFCSPIVLARIPISSLASIAVDSVAADPSTYSVDLSAGLVEFLRPTRGRCAVIGYTAGYRLPNDEANAALADLPAAVESACIATVKVLWFSGGASARDPAVRSDQVELVGSTSYFDAAPGAGIFPPGVAESLLRHRMPVC